jgi:hypothetical protein
MFTTVKLKFRKVFICVEPLVGDLLKDAQNSRGAGEGSKHLRVTIRLFLVTHKVIDRQHHLADFTVKTRFMPYLEITQKKKCDNYLFFPSARNLLA